MPKIGRPKKATNKLLSRKLCGVCSEADKLAIERAWHRLGYRSESDFLRVAALEKAGK